MASLILFDITFILILLIIQVNHCSSDYIAYLSRKQYHKRDNSTAFTVFFVIDKEYFVAFLVTTKKIFVVFFVFGGIIDSAIQT